MSQSLLASVLGAFKTKPSVIDKVVTQLSGHSLTTLLPLYHYDEALNLIYLNQRVGFTLELSPLCGLDESALALLKTFLADNLPEGTLLQFTLWASPRIDGFLNQWAGFRGEAGAVFEELAKWRVAYLQQANQFPLFEDEPHLLRDFRLIVSVTRPLSDEGSQTLLMLRSRLESTLKTMGFFVVSLPIESTLNLLDELLNPSASFEPLAWQPQTPLNAHLAHPDYQLVTYPEHLTINNEQVVQLYSIRQFPKNWVSAGMSELLGSFLRPRLQVACPFLINVLIEAESREKDERRCLMKALRSERLLSSGVTRFFPKMRDVAVEWQEAKTELEKGERFLKVAYQVVTYSPKERAAQDAAAMMDLYTANGWKLHRDTHVCLGVWLSSLPLVGHGGYAQELKKLQRFKTVMTRHAVQLLPIHGEYKGGSSPCLLLAGRRGQPLWFDPFDNPHGNYNTTVVGKSGSGKSVLMQDLVVGLAGSGARVFVIDIGRSFQHVCEFLEGEFMEFHYDNPLSLNPFTGIHEIRESLELLKPLIGQMISQSRQLSDFERAILEKAILAVWEEQKNETTITAIADYLLASEDSRSRDMGTMLFPYTREGMYGAFFDGPCSLKLDARVMVLELEELKARKDLQSVVFMLLFYHITEAMYRGSRQERIACIIDEVHEPLKDGMSTEFADSGSRRARKYNAAIISGTQSVNDYVNNPAAMAMYENADNRVFLSHNMEALEAVNEAHNGRLFKAHEIELIKTLKTVKGRFSELLIKSPIGSFVARYYLDPLTQFLYSTSPEIHSQLQALRQQGLSMREALYRVHEQQSKPS